MTRDLNQEDNFISTKSKASEPPINHRTDLKPFKRPRLFPEQNTRATTPPVLADADGLGVIPMTVPNIKKKGSSIPSEEPGSMATGPRRSFQASPESPLGLTEHRVSLISCQILLFNILTDDAS